MLTGLPLLESIFLTNILLLLWVTPMVWFETRYINFEPVSSIDRTIALLSFPFLFALEISGAKTEPGMMLTDALSRAHRASCILSVDFFAQARKAIYIGMETITFGYDPDDVDTAANMTTPTTENEFHIEM